MSLIGRNVKCTISRRLRDNGIGFEPGHAANIFKSFTRLNPRDQYEGTGLGLSLCRRIAERLGGSIEAKGFPGKGAEFIVSLPYRQNQTIL